MGSAFDRKLRRAMIVCNCNLLLGQLGLALAVAGAVAALAAAIERAVAVPLLRPWTLPTLVGAAVVAALALWFPRRVRAMQAALAVDERLALKARFSTALALAGSTDPFALAAEVEARQAAEGVSLKAKFRIRPQRRWLGAVAAWSAAAAVLAFMPCLDLLGAGQKRQQANEQQQKLQQAKVEVQQAAQAIQAAVRQLDNSDLDAAAKDLAKIDGARPAELKRRTIEKLTDLSEKIKLTQQGEKFQSAEAMNRMLTQLRGTPQGLSRDLDRAMQKGDFKKAANLLESLRQQVNDDKMTPQQKDALAKQMAELGKQLKKLAEDNGQLKDDLEKAGLTKELAKLDPEKLKEALEKAGLTPEQVEDLMKKATSSKAANALASQLGSALSGLSEALADGELTAAEMQDLLAQLEAMEAIQQDLQQLQASLAQVQCMACMLGEGMGLGAQGMFAEGDTNRWGAGTGGPGKGSGPRDASPDGKVAYEKSANRGPSAPGAPIVASWYFKGQQVKGESRKEFSQAVQAGNDSAAEAIGDNRIPRKYQGAIKKYFGDLEEQAKPSDK